MTTVKRRTATAFAGIAALAVVLTGCGSSNDDTTAAEETPTQEVTEEAPQFPVTVTDMAGNEVTIESADRVIVTDNRLFQLADEWDIPLVAAPRALMSPNNPLATDESIVDLGNHGEPNLEEVINTDPDLVINGYRFAGHEADMRKNAAGAAFVAMDVPEGSEMGPDEYVVQSLTLMGEIFGKQDEAATIIDEFHAAVDAAKAAYNPETTVMGLVVSGKEINYASHIDGRGASTFFQLVGMTPAMDTEGSTNHQGDDISEEAIAEANPDFFLVLDREAAVGEGGNTPALETILGSQKLAEVTAVKNEAIYVMPADYYVTEDVFAYMTVLNGLAESFGAQ